jgi:predicted anti-sigma-YlaC factor YlaD
VRCADLDELVEAVVAGDPVSDEARAHLAGCASCQARVEHARALERLLLSREVPEPPARFTMDVLRRVRRERWRAEQFVDAGFNLALALGGLIVLGGAAGLLWSFGWISIDAATLSTASAALAPWATRILPEAQTLVIAALLLSSALALWWWVENGEEAL